MADEAPSRAERGRVHIPEDVAGFGGARHHLKVASASRLALEQSRNRLTITASLFALCFLVLAGRLLYLGFVGANPGGSARVAAAHRPLPRADILDRNGVILATNLVTASLYADTRNIPDPQVSARRLVSALPDLDHKTVLARLKSGQAFVWLKRNLTPQQQQVVNNLGLPGLGFVDEPHRVYPQGRLCAHVLGFVDIDNNGIAGAERHFNATLRDPEGSGPLALALDVRVQHIVRNELQTAIADFGAIGGTGIVLDAHTGEVLAMVSLPDFDPNEPGTASADTRFNRATLGVYEMGSTFKTFTLAMGLDHGVARLSSVYDATNPIQVGRFRITDYHPEARPLNLPEIFVHSSNIGAAKIALDVGGERQRMFLKKVGLLEKSPIELPEVGLPLAPAPWREVNTLTIGFGHGIAVTPIHMAGGVASLVNGGHRVSPTLRLRTEDAAASGPRVLKKQTSTMMRGLMRLVVEEGTGSLADVDGYAVGGKTGTAEKAVGGSYKRRALLTSFISIFPSSEPRYVVMTMLDEPKPTKKTHGYATAGWTAAPTAGRIIERIAPLLGVAPAPKDKTPGATPVLVSFER